MRSAKRGVGSEATSPLMLGPQWVGLIAGGILLRAANSVTRGSACRSTQQGALSRVARLMADDGAGSSTNGGTSGGILVGRPGVGSGGTVGEGQR